MVRKPSLQCRVKHRVSSASNITLNCIRRHNHEQDRDYFVWKMSEYACMVTLQGLRRAYIYTATRVMLRSAIFQPRSRFTMGFGKGWFRYSPIFLVRVIRPALHRYFNRLSTSVIIKSSNFTMQLHFGHLPNGIEMDRRHTTEQPRFTCILHKAHSLPHLRQRIGIAKNEFFNEPKCVSSFATHLRSSEGPWR